LIPAEKQKRRRPPRFELIGGDVSLDFLNTLDGRGSQEPKELLASYLDLTRFAEDAGILGYQQIDQLIENSRSNAESTKRALQAAIELREAMYAVFGAVLQKKPVPPGPLYLLNQFVQDAARHMNLVPVRGSFEWKFDDALIDFEAPLWPIARAAADLLASDRLQFVRACAAKTCEWMFLDESKNHRRRWCDMAQCGNRAKVRRFYTRKKKIAPARKSEN
jgi:predicted RNA-binding Zn ribbon-like protein